MPLLLALTLLAACGQAALSLWLSTRQIAAVRRHQDHVPAPFVAAITLQQHRHAADYTVARQRVGMSQAAFGLLLEAAWLLAGYDGLFGLVADAIPASIGRSVVFLLLVNGVAAVLALPFQLLSTFGVERRYGFNRTTPALFAADLAKGTVLSLLLTAPLLCGVFWVMRHASGLWWLWTWAGLVVMVGVLTLAYPRWIAPLFNRFQPLSDAPLRSRVEALMARCGFQASGLFTMDASRRSAHGNAYFTGFGRTKRIVLFDTLVDRHPGDELEAVLAHELGHFHHRHILWAMARTAALSLIVLWAFGWLIQQPWLLPGFGFRHHDPALALAGCLTLASALSPLNALVGNWLSRRAEFQADAFARHHVGASPMVSALTRLTRDNAGTLTPDPVYALFNLSHPPVPERVQRLQASN